MLFSCNKIKCQLSLALLFSSLTASACAVEIPTAPVCQVSAKVISVSGTQAMLEITAEKKIKDGYDKDHPCNYGESRKYPVNITPQQAKELKTGQHITADLQQHGDESQVWAGADNIKLVK